MLGQMMHRPMLIADILEFAADAHGDEGIVSVTVEGGIHRQTYRETLGRAAQMAGTLLRLGMSPGDRIATLAWNGYRHMELYYAIPGIGCVCHTLNPRLSAEQLIYIINHAEDRLLFLDLTFVPIIEALRPKLPKDLRFVVMTDAAHMPDSKIDFLCYEDLLYGEPDSFPWPEFDENTAAGLCYTSGTTGNPKGSLYSHRSMVFHAMMSTVCMNGSYQMGRRFLPVVPLFHANCWGMAHAGPLNGVTMVMPGPKLDGASLYDLMQAEQVYSAWGVPTVWLGLMAEIEKRGKAPDGFRDLVVGGSAAAGSLIAAFEAQGVDVVHAWGMTEMSPLGTQARLTPAQRALPKEEQNRIQSRQGRRAFGVEMRIVGEDGKVQPQDGTALGELQVRGNGVVSGYFKNPEASAAAIDEAGWFKTGDVASIHPDGFLAISDRTKDLIKSGGEWISSIDVENMALGHEHVANCAVIAVPDEKWGERPVLIAVPAPGIEPDSGAILDHLGQHLAKWQVPDRVVFVEDLPLTATGKVSKLTLRQQFAEKLG